MVVSSLKFLMSYFSNLRQIMVSSGPGLWLGILEIGLAFSKGVWKEERRRKKKEEGGEEKKDGEKTWEEEEEEKMKNE